MPGSREFRRLVLLESLYQVTVGPLLGQGFMLSREQFARTPGFPILFPSSAVELMLSGLEFAGWQAMIDIPAQAPKRRLAS